MLTESTAYNERNSFDWIPFLQAVLSTYAALNAFGGAFAALFALAFLPVDLVSEFLQPGLLLSLGLALIVIGCLLIPSALIGFYRLRRLPIPRWLLFISLQRINGVFLVLLILVLIIGVLLFTWPEAATKAAPFLSILAISLPILIYINIGSKNMAGVHPKGTGGFCIQPCGNTILNHFC